MDKTRITVFGAEWCPGCKQLKAALIAKSIEFDYMDVDANPAQTSELGIRSLPTTIVHGTVETRIMGNHVQKIIDAIQ